MKATILGILGAALLVGTSAAQEKRAPLDTEGLPAYLRDRGQGTSLSQFASYVQKRELIIYPFYEYYHDSDYEYSPNELGQALDQDFRGSYKANEVLLFLAYGVTERLAIELEAAYIDAELEKSNEDPTSLPAKISESGVGDVEGQIRYRWALETPSRPEIFSYFETVGPTQDEGSLIGTTDWEFKLGFGVMRGYSWGTVTGRGAVEYDLAEDAGALGELAVEYVRRLSAKWRVYGGFEGTQDEVSVITEAQWHFVPRGCLKMNSGFGLTSKATDWAPEVGVMLSL
ncbi:MAG TPA: hypothetical protein VFD07_04285 [Candidatus Krumholzibacteria bacterium]|nr:hypothetical protein [Candidatus Krumholzibacteria bacterium]